MKNRQKKRSRIMKAMLRKKTQASSFEVGYKCHSDGPYGDGYGDAQYGDRSD